MLLSSQSSYAQEWVDLLKDPNANFFEIQEAFYDEWGGKSYVKGKGYKQFKRWEYFWETRVNSDGSFPDYAAMWNSVKQHANQPQHRAGGGSGGNWTPIGPFDYQLTQSWSPGIGRVQVVAEDPQNSNIIYVGAPDGGIWKTTDGGSTWTPLGDDLPVIGVSGIAIDYANTDNIYISTGDPDGGDSYSIGVWKSTDAGLTWNQVGNPGGNNLNRIMIDPTNSSILFVVSSSGVWRSTDAGVNWTNVRTGNFDDMVYKPGDSQTIYAVTDEQFWRSTDGGNTWTQTTNGLPGSAGRMQIAVTAANNSYVYLLASANNNSFEGIYRSTNSGASFSLRNNTDNIFNGSTQAWYDLAITASQTDANTIITGCINLWRSTDGGTNMSQINNWSSPGQASYTHADIHYLKYFNNRLFCGSDGGVFRSTNDGTAFTDLTPGIQIGQFYTIAGTEQDPNRICGGLQDNGGFAWDGNNWKCYYGADGMESAVDENNSNLIFGMIQSGGLYRSTNGGNNLNNLGSPESGAWVTPMQSDPNADRLICGYNDLHEYDYTGGWNQISTFNFPGTLRKIEIFPANSQIIYVATTQNVYKTTNGGGNFTNITGSLNNGSGITSIECHPTDVNRVWCTVGGTGGNRVYYSPDGGTTWNNITGTLPNLPVNIIKYEVNGQDGLYLGTDVGVYYRDNNTGDWVPFSNNLPNVVVMDLEINQTAGLVRAGTYGRGVWSSGTYDQLTDNAGLTAVIKPNGNICGSTFTPEVTLINSGSNAMTSATITYDIDGAGAQVFNWTGNLAPFASANVVLPSITTTAGNHVFNAVVSNPNGTPDLDPSNDAVSSNFSVSLGGAGVTLTLNTDCWGSEITWEVQDGGGTVVASGGPYTNVTGGETITEIFCLADACYDFIINDSYGDGLNGVPSGCAVNGSYTITDDLGTTLATMTAVDGAFGNQEVNNFCLTTGLTAAFSGTPTNICVGGSVAFTDGSSGSPTTWSWSFPGGTPTTSTAQNPTVTYSNAGTYDVTLTVGDGSTTDNTTITGYVTVISGLTVNSSATDESCAGSNDGTATANATNGTGPFTYLWDDAGAQTTSTATGLAPGNYNCTITDAGGCTGQATVTVGSATGMQVDFSITTDCWGSETTWEVQDGSGTVLYSGGPYGDQTPNGTGTANTEVWCLAPGCYDFIINDTYGDGMGGSQWGSCNVDGTYSIDVNGTTVASIINADFGNQEVNNFCVSANPIVADFTGNPTAVCEGGTVQFSDASSGVATGWTWTFPGGIPGTSTAQNPTVTYSTAGTYDVTLVATDGLGTDTKLLSGYITVNAPATLATSSVDALCNTSCDGSATASATGSGPFSYAWDAAANNQTTATATNLCSGAYTVTVTDSKGCVSQTTTTVVAPSAIALNSTSTDATCGASDGTATVNATGGTGAFSYAWSPSGGSSSSASGLTAGVYSVTVTDANGCSDQTSVTVNNSGSLSTTTTSLDENCGGADGSATVTPAGGSGNYSYSWSSGGTGATETGLAAGTYTVTITDLNTGCINTETVTIANTGSLSASTTSLDENCGAADGSATVTPSGGSGNYSYAWSSGGTSATETGLAAGTYTVTITDLNTGCSNTETVTIANTGNVTATISNDLTICEGAQTTLTASGGNSFSWDDGSGVISTNGSVTVSPTSTTTYTATVSSGSCSDVATVTVTVLAAPATTISGNTSICEGESTTLTATGGSSFVWGDGETTTSITVSPSTTTTYSVIGSNGNCQGPTATITVTVDPMATAVAGSNVTTTTMSSGATVNFNSTGSVGNDFDWNFGDANTSNVANPTHSYSAPGTYTVILWVTSGSCPAIATDTLTIEVTEGVGIEEGVLNAQIEVFPNPTDGQLSVSILDWDGKDLELILTDARGRLVYNESFDGVYGNHILQLDLNEEAKGVYFLQLRTENERKTVKIIRQ